MRCPSTKLNKDSTSSFDISSNFFFQGFFRRLVRIFFSTSTDVGPNHSLVCSFCVEAFISLLLSQSQLALPLLAVSRESHDSGKSLVAFSWQPDVASFSAWV